MSPTTIRHNLGMARTFFERIIDWDYPDAPRRVPIFTGDLPKADEPTPKFLDDPTAAKFMAALATDPNRRRRLIVELLARTGMRAGELGGLRDDAMYRIGDTYWLRIPLGKLHNDRSVPLHPLLVGLINDYRAWRGPTGTGLLVERDDHQPFDRRTIHRYVAAVARRAGVGHVHPHQLRHTLATQCLNRGMSLEAIAALLGHRSPRMTLVYARIADTVVADQYFTATRAVEADAPAVTLVDQTSATPPHGIGGCSATATAPDPSSSTAGSTPSAKAAGSSRPDPSSSPSCAANATTPSNTTTRRAVSSTTSSSASPTTDRPHPDTAPTDNGAHSATQRPGSSTVDKSRLDDQRIT